MLTVRNVITLGVSILTALRLSIPSKFAPPSLPYPSSSPNPRNSSLSALHSAPSPSHPNPKPPTSTLPSSTTRPRRKRRFRPTNAAGRVNSPPAFDDGPEETEYEIAAAYEELYVLAYSGVSVLSNDIYVMDSKVKRTSAFGKVKKEKTKDGFEERVVQVRRVTKVVKGGKQLHFRAIVVVGDKQGRVGVRVGKAKEVIDAVQKSATNARRNIIAIPMTKYLTFPHRSEGDYGAATVILGPAAPGTGVIAGGAVRIVLEMAGVENALGKQLGSKIALNNARATVVAVQKMKQFREVSEERGIPMEELWR
ncbi:30S ribosomal protein S5 [Hibiscus syriacus]|uniref:Small ribosomal subunit protein uS5c n=1 Tax=Hibiscus syriacus TaxID=106335 RepID=A0A6A2Z460_HIBSY|nr:30S ribosomal protein S5 [Hibiscus syriacus]